MKPIPVILDVDTGVDDAVAITLAARCRSIKLLGLVASFGNRPLHYTLRNTLWLKELLALDVPVCKGAAVPLCQPDRPELEDSEHIFHGKEGMGNAVPPPSLATAPDSDDPVAFLADLLEKSEEPVALVPVGPLTNLARLVTARPDLIEKIRVISLMGGAAKGGNVTPYSEVNIYNDPEAAATVFACGAPSSCAGWIAPETVTSPTGSGHSCARPTGTPSPRSSATGWSGTPPPTPALARTASSTTPWRWAAWPTPNCCTPALTMWTSA